VLVDEMGWPLREILATAYFRASVVKAIVCLAMIAAALAVRSRPRPGRWAFLMAASLLLAISAALTSHAMARIEHRSSLLWLDALHQLATGVWVGGLFHLVAAAARDGGHPWPVPLLRRFSTLSLVAVIGLVASGAGLAFYYIDGVPALLGTGYGLMVLTKVVILAGLSILGTMNFFAVRDLAAAPETPRVRLRRFVEVELGLGLVVFFAAASLTSLPPAVDVVADRATISEVGTRFTPRWPSLSSPPIEALPVGDREAPRTDEDRAWSEYNHHMAGLFVVTMGLLALLSGFGVRWARHWPLVFLAMAAFLVVRNDPGSWPLGPEGFWEGFAHVEVLQHRIFVLLVIGFGVFEWMVRTGRLSSPRCALVFPILCVVGGGLLLTHSHASINLKAEYLLEVTHAPLGVLALGIGWLRWLELRLPPTGQRTTGRLWAGGMMAIGLLLLLYRES
ncbi:MAG TPA: CopD family protein, partial [Candidatus Methylomirabilis sp.]|nr:CopD family protein [Candidatus Methylomirabilis sp.]